MPTRVVPGSGAIFKPYFDSNYSVVDIEVIDGGSGYAKTDPPQIKIQGTINPVSEGSFYPIISSSGEITRVVILDGGYGYNPAYGTYQEIGIQTTSYVESSNIIQKGTDTNNPYVSVASTDSNIIMSVIGGEGSSIYENGYNVAISTTVIGVSSSAIPNFSSNQNEFYGFFNPLPAYLTSGSGTGAKFSVFIVYNSTTGVPISTSLILREGGRGYSIGDTVSIAGTFINGSSPENDLTFTISKLSNTRIVSAANSSFNVVPSTTVVGFGTGAKFNISRDSLGDISVIDVSYGGSGYAMTDKISIAGTYIGGITPQDNLLLSPNILGTDKLPKTLYVNKIDDNNIKVSGLSTSQPLNLLNNGIGTHSFTLENPNASSIIAIDNVVQNPIYNSNLNLELDSNVSYSSSSITVTSGISSIFSTDIIKIDNELMKIINLGLSGLNAIEVERGYMGTEVDSHESGTIVEIVRGNYNIIKDEIHFASPPYGPTGLPGIEITSRFNGRAFSRRFDPGIPNDKNIILDDISDQFTGIGATEFILKSNNDNVVGIFTNTNSILGSTIDINNNPFIMINNIPQISKKDFTIDTPGQNTIKFISGVPLAGKITKVGITTGYGYMPLVGASATVSVSSSGSIDNVYLTGYGSGYRTPPVIDILSPVGSGAKISASVGVGGSITNLSIVNSGYGYTNSQLPIVRIGIPSSYSDLALDYVSGSGLGQDARVSVVVGSGSSIIGFNLEENGVSYKVGDVLKVVGITTNPNVGNSFEEFEVTVEEIFTDKFSGFYPGQFIQFDSIGRFFNGIKTKFVLTVTIAGTTEVLSLKTDPNSDLRIENTLFVYINDVLQVPEESYTYSGSRIIFKEAPKKGSKCDILFYRGSDLDVEQIDPPKTIKEGDVVRIKENIFDPFDREQFDRVVKNIVSTDILDTFPYDSLGINTNPIKERPLDWTKQTQDKIINGVLYSKSRPGLKSRIIPNTNIIKSVSQDDEQIYVNNAFPLFSDLDKNKGLSEDLRDVFIVDNIDVTPGISTAIVSTATTISSIDLTDPGSGYYQLTNPEVAISPSFIIKKDPIYNWQTITGISTLNYNSISAGNLVVTVGQNNNLSISTNGLNWNSVSIGGSSIINFNGIDVAQPSDRYVAVGSSANVYRALGVNNSTTTWTKVPLIKEVQYVGQTLSRIPSTYSGSFNDVSYNSDKDIWAVVGTSGGLFSSVGINTDRLIERIISFNDLNAITNNGSTFVSVGNNGDIVYSPDGIFWYPSPTKITVQNLNDVVWDGSKFIAVGNNGIILVSSNGIDWSELIIENTSINFKKIKYYDNFYTSLDSNGDLLFSFDLIHWVERDTNQSNPIKDLIYVQDLGDDGRYIGVGNSGTIIYAEPIINKAVAISTVSDEKVSSITILNGGFGYTRVNPPPVLIQSDTIKKEEIKSIKAVGDFGTIIGINTFSEGTPGIGTTSPKLEFVLKSEFYDNDSLGIGYSSLNTYGIEYSSLSVGDYFVLVDTNATCGHALTGITTSKNGMANYPESRVGTAVSFLDGVYIVERVTPPSLGIVTVSCNFAPIPSIGADVIQVNPGVNTTGYYGSYSWSKIFGYEARSRGIPKEFIVNTNNGLVGLDTGPKIYRSRGLI